MAPLQVVLRPRPGNEAASHVRKGVNTGSEGVPAITAVPSDEQLRDALNNVLLTLSHGEGASVIAYGSWGSGKSSALGTLPPSSQAQQANTQAPGAAATTLMEMALSCVFGLVGEGGSVSISCVEVLAGDEFHDLLDSCQQGGALKQQMLKQERERQRMAQRKERLQRSGSSRGSGLLAGPMSVLRCVSHGLRSASVLVPRPAQPLQPPSKAQHATSATAQPQMQRTPSSALQSQASINLREVGTGSVIDETSSTHTNRAAGKILQVQALTSSSAASPEDALATIHSALGRRLSMTTPLRTACHLGHTAVRLTWTPPGPWPGRVSHSSQVSWQTTERSVRGARSMLGSQRLGSCSSLTSSLCSSAVPAAPVNHRCSLTLLDCCSQMAAVHLPNDRASSNAKRALLSLGKSLSYAHRGEAAMALRESQLTRSLIGCVNQILLVACVGGSLDTPIPSSGVAATSGAPPCAAAVAAASDQATLKLAQTLLQGNRWHLLRPNKTTALVEQQQQQQQGKQEPGEGKQEQQGQEQPGQEIAPPKPSEDGSGGVCGPSTPEQSTERSHVQRLRDPSLSPFAQQVEAGVPQRAKGSLIPPPALVLPCSPCVQPRDRYSDADAAQMPSTPSPSGSYVSATTPESSASRSPGAGLRPRWLPASRIPRAPSTATSPTPLPASAPSCTLNAPAVLQRAPSLEPRSIPPSQQANKAPSTAVLVRPVAAASIAAALPKPSSPSRLPPRYRAPSNCQASGGISTPPRGPRTVCRLSSSGYSPQARLATAAMASKATQHQHQQQHQQRLQDQGQQQSPRLTSHMSMCGSQPPRPAPLPALDRVAADLAPTMPYQRSRSALSGCVLPSGRNRQQLEQQYATLLAEFHTFTTKPLGRFRSPSPVAGPPTEPAHAHTHPALLVAGSAAWSGCMTPAATPAATINTPRAAGAEREELEHDLFSWPVPGLVLLERLAASDRHATKDREVVQKAGGSVAQGAVAAAAAQAKPLRPKRHAARPKRQSKASTMSQQTAMLATAAKAGQRGSCIPPCTVGSSGAAAAHAASSLPQPSATSPQPPAATYSRIPSITRGTAPSLAQATALAASPATASSVAAAGARPAAAVPEQGMQGVARRPSYPIIEHPIVNWVGTSASVRMLPAGIRQQSLPPAAKAAAGSTNRQLETSSSIAPPLPSAPRAKRLSPAQAAVKLRQQQALQHHVSRIPTVAQAGGDSAGHAPRRSGSTTTPSCSITCTQSHAASSCSSCSELVGASLLVDKAAPLPSSSLSLAALPAEARLLPLPPPSRLPLPTPPASVTQTACPPSPSVGPIPRKMSFAEWEKESSIMLLESDSLPALLLELPLRERYSSAQLPDELLLAGLAAEPAPRPSRADSLGTGITRLAQPEDKSAGRLKRASDGSRRSRFIGDLKLPGFDFDLLEDHPWGETLLCSPLKARQDLDLDSNVVLGCEAEL